jgi:hypothetical protein
MSMETFLYCGVQHGKTRKLMQSRLCWISAGISWEMGGGEGAPATSPPLPDAHTLQPS